MRNPPPRFMAPMEDGGPWPSTAAAIHGLTSEILAAWASRVRWWYQAEQAW